MLRASLIEAAREDPRIAAAAVTGSAALDQEDLWSDIDLAFGLRSGAEIDEVLFEWTHRLNGAGAVDHVDVKRGATVYRVFLMESTLQVDLAFSPPGELRAFAPSFRLVFGTPAEPETLPPQDAHELIGIAWLHALHARSSIARDRPWQAEYMIRSVCDNVLVLACIRHRVPAHQGRGLDRLPTAVKESISRCLVRSLDAAELTRAFKAACEVLLDEVRAVDQSLEHRLKNPFTELCSDVGQ